MSVTVNNGTPTTNFVVQETTYPTAAHVYFYSNVAGTIYETYNGIELTSSNYSTAKQITKSVTAGNGSSTNGCDVDSGSSANSWTIYAYFVPTDGCYNHVKLGPKTLKVNKANGTVSISNSNVAYNSGNNLVSVSGATGTVYYRLGTSGSFSTTIPTATSSLNATSYTLYYYVAASSNYTEFGNSSSPKSLSVSIKRTTGSVSTAPANVNAVYGSGNVLCSTGSGTGTMMYRLGTSGDYSADRPTTSGLNAGSYTLYYYAAQSTNYEATTAASISVTVVKANQSAPTASGNLSIYATSGSISGSASGGGGQGTLYYRIDTSGGTSYGDPTSTAPSRSRTSVGTTTFIAYWGGNGNYNASGNSNQASLVISQATGTVSFTLTNRSLDCTSTANAKSATDAQKTTDVFLSNASTNTGQTISYSMSVKNSGGSSVSNWTFDSSTGKVTIPSGQAAGTYTVSITASVPNSTNYTAASSTKSATVTINQVVLSSLNMVLRSNSIAYNETKNLATSSNASSEVVDTVTATYSNGASKEVRVDTTYSGDSTYVTITN